MFSLLPGSFHFFLYITAFGADRIFYAVFPAAAAEDRSCSKGSCQKKTDSFLQIHDCLSFLVSVYHHNREFSKNLEKEKVIFREFLENSVIEWNCHMKQNREK